MASREEKHKSKHDEIAEEEKKEKRTKNAKLIFKILLVLFVIFSVSYFYVTYVATKGFIVLESTINDKLIPSSFHGKKIIHFSDLHYGSTTDIDDLKKIVSDINERNVDLVFFTGDLIDEKYDLKIDEAENITKQLQNIKTTLGKYAVNGEEDDELYLTLMKQSEFNILSNDYDLVYSSDNFPILVVGLDSFLNDKQDIDNAFRYFKEENHNSNIYTFLLMHEPDSIESVLASYKTDVALAGHSHSSQVRLPLIGGINKLEGAIKYDDLYYKVKDTHLYISSGLGTSNYLFRIGAQPSINFFRLNSLK